MTNKVAFNAQDRALVSMGNTLIVTTQTGDTFGLDLAGHQLGQVFKFAGARADFNPQDRFVVTMGSTLIVLTDNGDVFGSHVGGRTVDQPFKFSGSKVAFNHATDRFVVTMGNRLIVLTQNGDVFGHDVSGRDISQPFKFTGSKVAFNHATDRFVVTMGNRLIVLTQNGDVFGHDVAGRDIGQPFKFTGSKAAFNHEQDRFVTTIGNMLIVSNRTGDAFGQTVSGRDISNPLLLNPTVKQGPGKPDNPELGDPQGKGNDKPEAPKDPSPEDGPTKNNPTKPEGPGGFTDGPPAPETGCFIGSTTVLMADSRTKRIDAIVVGDQVIARDEITGMVDVGVVDRVFRHYVKDTLLLQLDGGEVIETTAAHRFATEGRGFIGAGELSPGESLLTNSKQASSVISLAARSAEATVYNLSVDRLHTFFVGDAELWVHNVKKASPPEEP